jgi:3-hydroxyanthranilate 3,4-dioxygenase
MDEGEPVDIPIKEGDIFLLPAGVPHSPQRPENTIGLVIERQREPNEVDGLRWYCDNCAGLLHEENFFLEDIVGQLKTAIESFYGSEEHRTCRNCGTVMAAPQ